MGTTLEYGNTMFHVVNIYTKAAQYKEYQQTADINSRRWVEPYWRW